MSFNLNPQGINGPVWGGNASQSDVRNPVVNANVASYAVGANMLNLTWPIPAYNQPNYPAPATTPAFPLGGSPPFVLLQ